MNVTTLVTLVLRRTVPPTVTSGASKGAVTEGRASAMEELPYLVQASYRIGPSGGVDGRRARYVEGIDCKVEAKAAGRNE